MKYRLMILSGFLIALSVGYVPTARTETITIPATTCRQEILVGDTTTKPRVQYTPSGAIFIYDRQDTMVNCPVPHSPPPADQASGGFFIDGLGRGGRIFCTLASYNFLGQFNGSQSIETPKHLAFGVFVELPASMVTSSDYITVTCQMPGTDSADGAVRAF